MESFARARAPRFALALGLAALASCASSDRGPAGSFREPKGARVPVYYATDRNDLGAGRVASERYGELQDDALHYGIAYVDVPAHHVRGAIDRPNWWDSFDEHSSGMSLDARLGVLDEQRFVASLSAELAHSRENDVLVYVHGFANSFADAALRTAQIAYDLGFQGRVAMFSWPSSGSTDEYAHDRDTVDFSRQNLRSFLDTLLTRVGARNVHVIAHSMGNRALIQVLEDFDQSALPPGSARLSKIVFAAPDVDAKTFETVARLFKSRAERLTLYASSNDLALRAAQMRTDLPRAGCSSPEPLIIEGIDTIDASAVDTSWTGHSYVADSPEMLDDLRGLICLGHAPDERGLTAVGDPPTRYWKLAARPR